MRLFVVLLSASLAFGATRKEPPDCSSRPCTYTITCAAKTCTAAEVREVQAALDDAHRGDTIKLQADRIFPSARNLVITRRPGSDGYLAITTTDDARLPDSNTRITPAYASLLPTLAVSSSGAFALGLAGNEQPAEYIRLLGLRFTAITNTQNALLMVGNSGNEFSFNPTSPLHQPDNIIIDRCVFDQDYSFVIRRLIGVHARRTTIMNSYLDGARELNSDTQSISAVQGPGPLTIQNSHIGGATENLIFGGDGPAFEEAVFAADIRFNYFPKVEERMRFRPWRAGMVVFQGRIIRPMSLQSGLTYQAQNSGVTGNVEPLWPAGQGETVGDNGIIWRRIGQNNSRTVTKNNLEIKSARNVTIQHNVFERHWFDTDQNNNIVFKLSNCVEKTSNCQCVPEYSGTVNVNGRVVTSADGRPLPNLHQPTARNNVSPFVIKIGQTDYQIESFEAGDDFRITLRSDAGSQFGVAYTYGQTGCRAAWDKDIIFRNNIVRSGAVGLSILQWTNGVRGRIGNILVRDNLFADLDCRKWSNHLGSCSTSAITPLVFLGTLPEKIELNHNTIIGTNFQRGIHFEGNSSQHEGDGKILNNILPRGSLAGIAGGPHQEGSPTLDNLLCGGNRCPESQFDRNIIVGVNRSRYTTGTTYNLCPGSGACEINWDYDDPRYGRLFENFNAGAYRVREGHYAKGGGTDGADIGADFEQLPQIRNLRVETTDRQALLSYEVSKPIEHIPCVIEVSMDRDLFALIPDLDPVRFLRPDTDHHRDSVVRGAQRMIRVGKNVPLSPEQTYWYRLQCGGDAATGSFTTKAPQTGSQRLTITHTPSASGVVATVIEFGYGYDRSSDAIINWTAAEPVSCSKDTACQISIAVDPGEILYYRTIDRDQNGAELARTPVMATSDPSAAAFPQPRFALDAVVNAAAPTYRAGEVAPCEIISIFGSGLGPEQPASFADVPLPESLANVRVLFDRKAAPLLFVWGGQLNSVAPARIAGQSLTEVQIEYGSQRSDPVMVPVAQVSPGVITNDGSGRGQGAVINPDGSFNGPSNPASRGSVVQVYGTSGGPMSPACEEGKIAEGPQYLQLPVSAVIGEGTSQVAASVEYAGSAPGSIMGLLQINLRIPENAPTGDAVPFTITIGGVPTQSGVTLAIR
jgi:uncharacterized protein (TIGR03437 family)